MFAVETPGAASEVPPSETDSGAGIMRFPGLSPSVTAAGSAAAVAGVPDAALGATTGVAGGATRPIHHQYDAPTSSSASTSSPAFLSAE